MNQRAALVVPPRLRLPSRAELLARWRRRRRRPCARPGDPPPALVPGLRIVWTPGIVVNGLRERLKRLGLDTPAMRDEALRRLHISLRPGTPATYETACPACGKRCLRLWWSPRGFRGTCCVDFAQHGPRCQGGRWPCGRHRVSHLERLAAEYLLACRLGAGQCAAYRRRTANRVLARELPLPYILTTRGVRLARDVAALAAPAPARVYRVPAGPDPVARALGVDLVRLLIDHVFGLPAYTGRVYRELVGGS